MRSRLFMSMFVIVLASVLVTAVTVAWFISAAAIPENVFTAGSLQIKLDDPQGLPFTVDNMAPGDVENGSIDVLGDGTLPFKLMTVITEDSANPDDPPGYLPDMLDVIITMSHGGQERVHSGTLTALLGQELVFDDEVSPYELPADGVVNIGVQVTFNEEADNDYQESTWIGTITFAATQMDNPEWGIPVAPEPPDPLEPDSLSLFFERCSWTPENLKTVISNIEDEGGIPITWAQLFDGDHFPPMDLERSVIHFYSSVDPAGLEVSLSDLNFDDSASWGVRSPKSLDDLGLHVPTMDRAVAYLQDTDGTWQATSRETIISSEVIDGLRPKVDYLGIWTNREGLTVRIDRQFKGTQGTIKDVLTVEVEGQTVSTTNAYPTAHAGVQYRNIVISLAEPIAADKTVTVTYAPTADDYIEGFIGLNPHPWTVSRHFE